MPVEGRTNDILAIALLNRQPSDYKGEDRSVSGSEGSEYGTTNFFLSEARTSW